MTSTEEFIQQKEFQSPWHKLRVNLLITSNWLKNEFKEFLDQFEITQQQYNILRILRGAKSEPLSTNEICDRMIDKMSDTSRIVDRLVAKNLAEKNPCPNDKRKIQVFISKDGEQLLSSIDAEMHALDAKFNHLSDKEAEQLNDLLEKLRG
ncbi:MAG: MarR family transcriptional regulator [Balneolaceae bacterium]|nr:MarR family transcriptional regulator [Balneolaceae bacterium]